MASSADFAAFVLEQARGAGAVEARRMFGEYALYCDGKVVALVCDDRLFLKPTPGNAQRLGDTPMAPPYPGARPHYVMDAELEDPERLCALLAATAAELPPPKPRKPRKPR